MGGGAAMRAAAKAAGAGFLNRGLGGIVPDHPVSAAARKAARPVGVFTATSSSSSPTDAVKASTTSVGIDQEAVQMPCWEFDEWEMAGGEEDFLGVANEGMPRLVFGGAPSIEEAKEATSELKDVIEKAYLSSSPSSPLSQRSQSEVLETRPCLTSKTVVVPAAPKHAMQAFRFLSENPTAQSVVASIACDPNVWNAVMLNPALQDYIQSQKISASNVEEYEKESTGSDNLSPRSPSVLDGLFSFFESGESKPPVGLMDYLQNIKLSVVDMMDNVFDYFHNIFGGYSGDKDAKGNSSSGFFEKALAPSLLGLAVMVIMVVVLKRA